VRNPSTGVGLSVQSQSHFKSISELDREVISPELRYRSEFLQFAVGGANVCVRAWGGSFTGKRVGIFLASGLGNISDAVSFYQSLFSKRSSHASPIKFAHSVGNAVTFYLARAIGVTDCCLAVSQEELSFESAVQCAMAYIFTGSIEYALVGGCDVHTDSDDVLRQRLGIGREEFKFGQGSSWVILKGGESAGAPKILPLITEASENIADSLGAAFDSLNVPRAYAAFGYRVNPHQKSEILAGFPQLEEYEYLHACGVFPTASAYCMASYLAARKDLPLIYVNQDFGGRMIVTRVIPAGGLSDSG
jgi:hypothetical protein